MILNNGFMPYELDNGLVVALQTTPTQTITGKLRVNFGPCNESKTEEGLSHFLEHCVMSAGSKDFSALESDKVRKSIGYSNAFTDQKSIFFPVNMLAEDLETWLKFISDISFSPRFDKERVEAERQRVLREIADAKSSKYFIKERELSDLFYRGHKKGIFVLGNEEVVSNADISKLSEFHKRGFNPNNMDLILVGNLPKNINELIKKYFGKYTRGENFRTNFPELPCLENKSIIIIPSIEMLNKENPEESSALIYLDFVTPSEKSKESYKIKTISHLLGSGADSRLHRSLSLKRGLAYQTNSVYSGDYNAGYFQIQAKVKATRLEEAISMIFSEIKRFQEEDVSEKEIEHTQKYLRFIIANQFDSNKGHVNAIEEKLDDNRIPEDYIEEFNKCTKESIREAAIRYLPESRETGRYMLTIRNPLE